MLQEILQVTPTHAANTDASMVQSAIGACHFGDWPNQAAG
jgi:hypothetical protein